MIKNNEYKRKRKKVSLRRRPSEGLPNSDNNILDRPFHSGILPVCKHRKPFWKR